MYISGLAPAKIKEPTFAPGPLLHGNIDCAAIAAGGEVFTSAAHKSWKRLSRAHSAVHLAKLCVRPDVPPCVAYNHASSRAVCLTGGTRVTKPVAFGGHVQKPAGGRIRFATPITSR